MAISGINGAPQSKKSHGLKTEDKIQVQEGISVDTIKKHGSKGQKLAVDLFDKNKNGILEREEADAFSNCIFKANKGSLTIYEKLWDKDKPIFTTEIKYGNHPELLNGKYNTYDEDNIHFDTQYTGKHINKNGMYYGGNKVYNGKTTIDLTKNTVTIQGGETNLISTDNANVKIFDSSAKRVRIDEGSVSFNNVANKGLFDSKTKVDATPHSVIKYDNKSKLDIKRK